MKGVLAVAVLALAVPAFAGQNPQVRAFVSFAPDCPDPYVHRVDPAYYPGQVDVYLMLDCFGEGGGVRSVWFSWTTSEFGLALATTYLLPEATYVGGPDQASVWVVESLRCTRPNECGVVAVLKQPYFATDPGTVVLGPHPIEGQVVVGCDSDPDLFCVLANGGIGVDPPPGDEDCLCEPPSPLEPSAWSSIKALYR